MNIEDIRIGETYYSAIRYLGTIKNGNIGLQFLNEEGNHVLPTVFVDHRIAQALQYDKPEQTSPLPSQPKYAPCRLFKKGDKVEYRPKDGRANPNLLVGRLYKVSADEPCDSGIVQVEFDGLRHLDTFVVYNNLQLVTPVELEPYSVVELCNGGYAVYKDMKTDNNEVCIFWTATHPHAKEAAEAESDRLNAVWRKENA